MGTSSTLTLRMPLTPRAGRQRSIPGWGRPRAYTMMDGSLLGTPFQQLMGYGLSWDALHPCAAPRASTATLIIMGADAYFYATAQLERWHLLTTRTSYIYDRLHSALKVFVDIRQRLAEDADLHMNLSKCQIYIPGVSLERAHELVHQKIEQDPSLASLIDVLDPSVNVITVTGMRCVGGPDWHPGFCPCICAR